MVSKVLKIGLAVVLLGLAGMATFYSVMFHPVFSFDFTNPPQVIKAHFMPLDKVTMVSKFRSGAGHDFSDHTSPCSSMKHYFQPLYDQNSPRTSDGLPPKPNGVDDIPIYSPVNGTVGAIAEEHTPIGKQITINVADQRGLQVRLFHVYPVTTLKRGVKLKAGDKVGVIGAHQGTDIAVQVNLGTQQRFISYFDVLPDSLFADYAPYGLTSREQVEFSQDFRLAHPLLCHGEQFINHEREQRASGDYLELKQP